MLRNSFLLAALADHNAPGMLMRHDGRPIDFAGYIPSARVLREGGYEGGGAMRGQDHPGPYTEAVEEIMIQKVRELIRRTGE